MENLNRPLSEEEKINKNAAQTLNKEELTEEEIKLKNIVDNKNRKFAENAVPPEAWKNQKKAYDDAWENNKNQALEDDV